MNITILDLFKFLRNNFFFAIIIFLFSGLAYYGYFKYKTKENVINFEVDLREWNNLNDTLLPWLENYKKFPNEVRYGLVVSFDSSAKCKTNESVTNVLFCSVTGPSKILDEQYTKFKIRSGSVLQKQKNQLDIDLRYFKEKIQRTKLFLEKSSQDLKLSGESSKLSDYNYTAFNQLAQMENDIEILRQVKENFKKIELVKNKTDHVKNLNNILFYSLLCSMLSLTLYIIVGVAYKASKKKSSRNIKKV